MFDVVFYVTLAGVIWTNHDPAARLAGLAKMTALGVAVLYVLMLVEGR